MKGLELARQYYEAYGKEMLQTQFPQVLPYLAIGLAGSGSECYGYDDEFSRDHDFGDAFADFDGGFEDGFHLGAGNFRIGDTQTDAAMTHHRVVFMESFGTFIDLCRSDTEGRSQFSTFCRFCGDEFMQRRIEQTESHRHTFHGFQSGFDAVFHKRIEFSQSDFAFAGIFGKNHLTQVEKNVSVK